MIKQDFLGLLGTKWQGGSIQVKDMVAKKAIEEKRKKDKALEVCERCVN